jgi:hypothetical protein
MLGLLAMHRRKILISDGLRPKSSASVSYGGFSPLALGFKVLSPACGPGMLSVFVFLFYFTGWHITNAHLLSCLV